MARPTDEEVMLEIATLIELKPLIRRRNFFGEDNHEAVQAQIDALSENMDEDAAYKRWGEDAFIDPFEYDEVILNHALDAIGWRDDTRTVDRLSTNWEGLIQ